MTAYNCTDYDVVTRLRLILLDEERARVAKREVRWQRVRAWTVPTVACAVVGMALWEIFRW